MFSAQTYLLVSIVKYAVEQIEIIVHCRYNIMHRHLFILVTFSISLVGLESWVEVGTFFANKQ